MMNRKWTALLCCMTLIASPMAPVTISQGTAGKQSQQAKNTTKTSRKTSKTLKADGAEQDAPRDTPSDIPSKKEQRYRIFLRKKVAEKSKRKEKVALKFNVLKVTIHSRCVKQIIIYYPYTSTVNSN